MVEERIVAADPVDNPAEYQREMVALLGGQDPVDVLGATVAALHRLTIAEIGNHPELSAHWGDGTDPFIDAQLAACLRHYDEAGLLAVPDPARSARQFAYLLVTEGRMASAYGTRNLTLEQRHEIAAETADLIARAHRPA